MASGDGPSLAEQAEEFLTSPPFNQTLTIPACDAHDELTVSYADCGSSPVGNDGSAGASSNIRGDGEEQPVVLFIPGMFASRYTGTLMHFFAKKHGVRLLVMDRFGMGKTTGVPINKRIDVWVTIVPKMLEILGIKHIILMSHSAGTIFSMNTLWHCRKFLHPKHPRVYFFGPWVDSSHVDSALVTASKALPKFALNYWTSICSFMVLRASVAFAASSGVLTTLAEHLLPGSRPDAETSTDALKLMEEVYGLPIALQPQISDLGMRKMFKDEVSGANDEFIMCLKRGPAGAWGEAEDMAALVKKMALRERESMQETQGAEKLSVKIFLAESDNLTGRAGQQYFESCWTGQTAGEFEDCFDVEARIVKDTDHDTVLNKVMIWKEVFETIGGVNGSDETAS